jgi:hypothetical protein
MSTHLIIPDSHAHPDFSNKRFDWLGKLILDLKPDVVIQIGDLADMPSLCSYDKGKKGFSGQRYHRDIDAANDALDRILHPTRQAKKKLPRLIALEGSHEKRIKTAISLDEVQLDGTISPYDIQFKEQGWEYVEYRGTTPGVTEVDGVAYAHYFTSGVMGRAIGGVSPAYQLLQKQYRSCTQGHIHVSDWCVRTDAIGRHIMGCVVGCYLDYEADYAGEANDLWWRGVVVKRGVVDGKYDPEWISLDRIRKAYK